MDKVLLFIKVLCFMIKSTISSPELYSGGFEEAQNRIIHGLPAKYEIYFKRILLINEYNKNNRKGQLPWHAIVRSVRSGQSGQYICGGAIISKSLVLTAAHCTEHEDTKFGPILVGEVSISNKNQKHYHARKIISHPNRNKDFKTNDLAIVQVTVPFKFSKNVQPIPIGNLSIDRLHENETVNVLELMT